MFGDGEATINLLSADGHPELIWADEMKRNDVRRAMTIMARRAGQTKSVAKSEAARVNGSKGGRPRKAAS
nr:hypothetical protein [Rhizobium sullae]